MPAGDYESSGPFECLICGTRGLADTILNVILFVPVGLLATLAAGASWTIVIAAGVFSAGVEIAQFWIPGRDASPPDLLFNTTGALVGVVLAVTSPRWIRPRRPLAATAIMAALTLAIVGATAWFSQPRVPVDTRWFGFWNADLDHLESYDGRVTATSVGPVRLDGSGWIEDSTRAALAEALRAGEPIMVRATAGTPPPGLAGLLAIIDENHREVLLIGPDGDDVVARLHLRSEEILLDKPDVRLRGALARYRPGDPIEIVMTRIDGSYCLRLGEEEQCGLGMDVSTGWTLLMSRNLLPVALAQLVSLAWAFGLAVLLGFYARTSPAVALGGGTWILAFVVIPAVDGYLLLTPWPAFAAAAAGFMLAAALGTRLTPTPSVAATAPVQHV